MTVWENVTAFCLCIAAMSWASVRLTATLERIGARLRISDGLLGILIALGADAPEICTAIAALLSAQHEVSVGIVLGSNIFNLAGLLGLSAVVAGRISIGRKGLLLNGGIGLTITVIALALVLRVISAEIALVLLVSLLLPYLALSAMHPPRIQGLRIPPAINSFLSAAIAHSHKNARRRKKLPLRASRDFTWLVIAVSLTVGASFGAVHYAVWLGRYWSVDETITGMLVLSVLTSVPNVVAAVKLANDEHGAAVISEALNSNSFNIIAGIALPAVVIGFAPPETSVVYAAIWLLFMTVVALFAAGGRRGLGRSGGALILLMYLLFAGSLFVGW
jgi:cation:H+ antiporter